MINKIISMVTDNNNQGIIDTIKDTIDSRNIVIMGINNTGYSIITNFFVDTFIIYII